MKKYPIILLVLLFSFAPFTNPAMSMDRPSWQVLDIFTKHRSPYKSFKPYLENTAHLQIPQWEDENWYVEDWTSQKDGLELIKGFYDADIIRDQMVAKNMVPVLVVGANFYHLSGLDKRRVLQTVDTVYGITSEKPNGSFLIKDWFTKEYIGAFDENGMRLN